MYGVCFGVSVLSVGGSVMDVNESVSCVLLYLLVSSSSLPSASLLAASLWSSSLLDFVSVFRNCSGFRVSSYALVFVPSSPDVITVSSMSYGCMVVSSFASASGRGLTWLPRPLSVSGVGVGEFVVVLSPPLSALFLGLSP